MIQQARHVRACSFEILIGDFQCQTFAQVNLEEHLYINESGRVGEVEPRGIAAYPYVNRGAMDQGWCEYHWLDNGERVERELLPVVDVPPELMPPPIVELPKFTWSKDWFIALMLEQAPRQQLRLTDLSHAIGQKLIRIAEFSYGRHLASKDKLPCLGCSAN